MCGGCPGLHAPAPAAQPPGYLWQVVEDRCGVGGKDLDHTFRFLCAGVCVDCAPAPTHRLNSLHGGGRAIRAECRVQLACRTDVGRGLLRLLDVGRAGVSAISPVLSSPPGAQPSIDPPEVRA